MSHKSAFFSILFCLIYNYSLAQNVPGYLGQRGMVEYHFNSPSILYMNNGARFMHEFRFSYVVARKGMIGVGYEFYSVAKSEEPIFSNSKDTRKAKGSSVIVNYDLFFRNSLAPVGSYIRVELKYLFGEFTNVIPNPFNPPEENTFKIPHVGVGYGIRRIFFDKMVFNVGAAVGWNTTNLGVSTNVREVLGQMHFLRFNLGVGVLLF